MGEGAGPGLSNWSLGDRTGSEATCLQPLHLPAHAHTLPPSRIMWIIAVAAVLQILVHLRFFLHVNFTTTPKENLLAVSFTAVLIFLMVGGSLWVMIDLHQRMAI